MTTFVYDDYRSTPDSSVIPMAYYNREDRQLIVQFKNGNLAGYNFGPSDWDDYLSAGSVGQFYNREIKDAYVGVDAGFDKFVHRSRFNDQPKAAPEGNSYLVTYRIEAGSIEELGRVVANLPNYDKIVKVEA